MGKPKLTRNLLLVLLLLALLTLPLASCISKTGTVTNSDVGWTIIRSPITGRYYEVATTYPGSRQGMMAMSEVSEQEYLDYLRSK